MEDMIIDQPEFQMPADGVQLATLVDYEDLGDRDTKFGMKHQVKLVWAVEDGSEGENRPEQWDWMNVSLHSMSTLYKVVSALLGGNPPKRLNLKDLVGKQCLITIRHYTGEDGKTKSTVDDYAVADGRRPQPAATAPITDRDLPF